MTDIRVTRAQSLLWEIEALRQLGAPHNALSTRRREAARLHEERARELLERGDVLGFTDLFAAATYWGQAGDKDRAESLLSFGDRAASALPPEGAENVRQELQHLHAWLKDLHVLPPLRAFARVLPPLPKIAA